MFREFRDFGVFREFRDPWFRDFWVFRKFRDSRFREFWEFRFSFPEPAFGASWHCILLKARGKIKIKYYYIIWLMSRTDAIELKLFQKALEKTKPEVFSLLGLLYEKLIT